MEISATSNQSTLNTQQNLERARDDARVEQTQTQNNEAPPVEDRATTAEPVEATSDTERAENRNNEQVEPRPAEAPSSAEENLGSQIDIRA